MSKSQPQTYADWLTKQQAAQELGVAEKTLDRMAERGEIQKAMRRRTGMAPVSVFHPGDIAAAKQRRAPVPYLAPAAVLATGSGPTIQDAGARLVDALRAITERLLAAPPIALPPAPGPELRQPYFLTLKQAREVSGLPLFKLRSMAVKMGRFWRVPRLQLERYARQYGQVSDTSGKASATVAA